MPSIRYMNQSAPFWDFVASLEQQGTEHQMLGGRNRNEHESSDEETGWAGPWGMGGWGWPGAGRGWQRGPGGPPPYAYPGVHPPPPHHDGPPPPHAPEKDGPPPPPGPPGPPGEPSDPPESVPPPHPPHHGRHGRHHGPHGEHHNFRRGGRCGGRGGFRGPWGRKGMGAFNMSTLSDFIQSQMFDGGASNENNENNENNERAQQDFKPEADVFDTEAAFVVHVSLPGAKKEDVAVNWDAEKSELSVGGVVHRPGDEEFLKTLALDERTIGAFERKIRLGSRANPALVDVDGISAKFEDGVLIVTVPKEDKDFVEVKKVDIE